MNDILFGNNNQPVVKKLAARFLKAEKISRRILTFTIMAATALMLSTVLILAGFSEEHKDTQRGKAQITMAITSNEQLVQLNAQSNVEWTGIYAGLGFSYQDGMALNVLYEDAIQLERQERIHVTGTYPMAEDEIILPTNYLKYLNSDIKINDTIAIDLTGTGKKEPYTVCGIAEVTSTGEDYFIWVSEAKALQIAADGVIPRTAYVRLNTETIDTRELQRIGRDIASNCGISEESVQIVNEYYAVMSGNDAGGTFPTMFPVGLTVLVLAGVVIYSIFYVSVTKNVRNYGQLRTLGLTKRQIGKMMRAEGRTLLLRGLLSGIILGGLVGFLANRNGFELLNFLLYGMIVAFFICLMTRIAIHVPVKIASNITPVEGIKYLAYHYEKRIRKRTQKHLTPGRLGVMNLRRSLKKTVLTTLMFSLSGIIFVGVCTVANSLSAEKMARFYMFPYGDIQIKIQEVANSTFDTDYGEVDRTSFLQRTANPLNQNLITKLEAIDGVNAVTSENAVSLYIEYDDNSYVSTIAGTGGLVSTLGKEQCDELSKAMVSGNADYKELTNSNGILMRANASGLSVGDLVRLSGTDGKGEKFEVDVPVIGIYEQGIQQKVCPLSSGSDFLVTDITAQKLTGIQRQTGLLSISVQEGKEAFVYQKIKEITDMDDELTLYALENSVKTRQALFDMRTKPLFMIAFILFMFAMISMTNTSLTNLLERSHELALMQSIGVTKKQQKQMIQTEECFYMGIAICATVLIGSGISIGVCNYIEKSYHCIQFQYPWIAVIVFLLIMLVVNKTIIQCSFRTAVRDGFVPI